MFDPFAIAVNLARHVFGCIDLVAAGYCAYVIGTNKRRDLWLLVPVMLLCGFIWSAFSPEVSSLVLPRSVRAQNFIGRFAVHVVWDAVVVFIIYLVVRRIRQTRQSPGRAA